VNQTDELAAVIELACQTADRTREEQRALLATALRVDVKRSLHEVTNPEPVRPWLFALAAETYLGPVKPSRAQREKFARRCALFDELPFDGPAVVDA
jgi:hypothetical protein